jgi:GTP-binding protein
VGKSSLLNILLGRKNFARVSKEPGKTRTVNFYLVDDRFYFVDLPGYGYAKVSAEMRKRWRRVIFDYLDSRDSIGGIVQLIDSRHPSMKDDILVLERLIDSGKPFLVVMTKADKIGRGQRRKVLRAFSEHLGGVELGLLEGGSSAVYGGLPVVFFSAKTGEGRDTIWRWIADKIK